MGLLSKSKPFVDILFGSGLVVGGYLFLKGRKLEKVESKELNTEILKTKKLDLQGKVYIVTGATAGIGKEIATTLATRRATVFMACKDFKKCEEIRENIKYCSGSRNVHCKECDLSSQTSIRKFVDAFLNDTRSEGRLDGLINNAGIMFAPRSYTEDGVECHLAVNHQGPFLLTHLLLDRLKASSPSRIVYLINKDFKRISEFDFDDINNSKKYDKKKSFYQSQMANMWSIQKLSASLQNDGVTVNGAYPGRCATRIKRHMSVENSYLAYIFIKPVLWLLSRSAKEGAEIPVFVATSECDSVRTSTGQLFEDFKPLSLDQFPLVNDKIGADKLYAIDLLWTKIIK